MYLQGFRCSSQGVQETQEFRGVLCIPNSSGWSLIYCRQWMKTSRSVSPFSEATLGSINGFIHIGESEIHGRTL